MPNAGVRGCIKKLRRFGQLVRLCRSLPSEVLVIGGAETDAELASAAGSKFIAMQTVSVGTELKLSPLMISRTATMPTSRRIKRATRENSIG